MATMTRERMKEIQREPKQTLRYVVRTGNLTKNGIEPYREDVFALALKQGEEIVTMGGDWRGWWPALAPLTKVERNEARKAVRRFSVVAEAA
jgi:hypothetical protein